MRDRYEDLDVQLVEAGGGVFEVTVDGRLIFSKKRSGRHPELEEIFQAIDRPG